MNQDKFKPGLMVHAKRQGKMEGVPGQHIGSIDHIDGERYIKLKKSDSIDGEHHWIPLNWVDKVDGKAVYLNKTEDECRAGMFDSFPGDEQDHVEEMVQKAG